MALERDAYEELVDIVGPENLSDDPAVTVGYSYFRGVGNVEVPHDGFHLRPAAVVLPGNTREVQAVIRWANRRGKMLKVFSTGFGPHNAVENEDQILVDMRRMNRILEIDEKNMYVVMEPYVSYAQVQAEAQKRGLNCHIVGAGSQVSALASMTSVAGTTTHGISQGHGSRNLLAMELVMPSGEILQFGSLGSGAGWFSSNGPGPSLRGMVRGTVGANGSVGIFTRCAMRLNPWYGPGYLKVNGNSPYYEGEVPENFEYHVLEWPTWEQYADAMYKIGRARIAFAVHKTAGPGTCGPIVTGCNNDYWAQRQAGDQAMPLASAGIVLSASSQKEHAYAVKVLDAILKDTGGSIFQQCERPDFKNRDYLNMVRACFIPRQAYRMTGSFSVDGIVGLDTIDNCALGNKLDDAHSARFRERGAIVNDGGNASWFTCFDGGHFAITECGQSFDPLSEESRAGLEEMVEAGVKISIETPINVGTSPSTGGPDWGPLCSNYHIWTDRIKKAYDPNGRFGGGGWSPSVE